MPGRKTPLTWDSRIRELMARLYKLERTTLKRIAYVATEPPDSDLEAAEMEIWLDATPGATKVMFKAKDSGGTVRTGSVNLT